MEQMEYFGDVNCSNKCAIAISLDNIYQYLPFELKEIPQKDRIFKDIGLNSAVKYYKICDNVVKDLFGTVRWTGVDEDDKYWFGIELDDRINDGTDGQFQGQRLFHCQNGHGILAAIDRVAKDTRFCVEDYMPDLHG